MRLCRRQVIVRNYFVLGVLGALILCVLSLQLRIASAQQDLSTMFQRAGDEFRPVTDQEIADARAELIERMAALERHVRPSSANGKRWLRYLRWDAQKQALEQDKPDPRALAETYQQLNRDEAGLEQPPFRRVSNALRRYNRLVQIAEQKDQAAYYRSQLQRLQTQLEEYRREPSARAAFEIGSRLGFVAAVGGRSDVVDAVRREFGQPNAFMRVSTSLIAAAAKPVKRQEWITDCILGATIHSDAHTRGLVGVAGIPSDNAAVLEFVSDGHSNSTSTGRKGPAVIHSSSVTNYTAKKRVELTDANFRTTSSRANATTHSNIHSVAKAGGGLGSRLVANIGWNQAQQSKGQADAIAADHAEGRIERQFNKELGDEVRKARERYEEDYRRPLERRGELPEHIRFSSDRRSIAVEVTQANGSQLGAAGPPPAPPEDCDMSMRLHESAVNNYSAIVLGGATASETEPGKDVQFDVKVPQWMRDAWKKRKTEVDETAASKQPFKPWSLRFRDGRPLSVKFAGGKVELTIHVSQLQSGDRTFKDWDITGTYTPELAKGGVVLRREGDLKMLPAAFRGTLSSRQVAERRNLEEELNESSARGRGFPRAIEFDPIEPGGALADAGPLDLQQVISENGWVTLAWNRQVRISPSAGSN